MQYHITQYVHGQQWEREQAVVIEDVRRQAEHDLSAQNPGSTVTIDDVQHTVRSTGVSAANDDDTDGYLVDFVVEYTVGGQTNVFEA